jgi:enoyl-CoA hydratase
MAEKVLFEKRGHLAIITLNRPEARNAVNADIAAGMDEAMKRLESDPDIWAAVLTANTTGQERPVFCAGADLKAINSGEGRSINTKDGNFAGFVYYKRTKPVIAAVDGLATAGGCEIALACDMIIATTRSSFGLAEVKRNLIAAAGGLYRLPRALGERVAMEVILTGEPLPAQRAFDLGMVNHLVEPGEALNMAIALAEKISENAPLAVRASRRVVLAAATEDDDTLIGMTNEEFSVVLESSDTREGLQAFIEKRPPRWTGF